MKTSHLQLNCHASVQSRASKDAQQFVPQHTSAPEVQVWFCLTNTMPAKHFNQLVLMLSQTERMRLQLLRHESQRLTYAVAHALVRQVLSRRLHCEADDLSFCIGQYGKPELDESPVYEKNNVHFNISHTHSSSQGLVAVVLANVPAGVDVEQHLVQKPVEMAQMCLTRDECIRVQKSVEPQKLFRRYWVMKEAIAKAMGIGLSAPLQSLAIEHSTSERGGWFRVLDGFSPAASQNCWAVRPVDMIHQIGSPASWDAAVAIAIPKAAPGHHSRFKMPDVSVNWITCEELVSKQGNCPQLQATGHLGMDASLRI